MSKSLKTIQIVCKIAKIVSTVLFVLAVIGAAGCAISIPINALFGDTILKIGGTTIRSAILKDPNYPEAALYLNLAIGLVICGTEIFLMHKAKRYFTHELEAGTPFTLPGAKELRRLGILNMAVSLGAAIVCGIAVGICKAVIPEISEINFSLPTSIGFGLALLLLSFVCEHGAELNAVINENNGNQTVL